MPFDFRFAERKFFAPGQKRLDNMKNNPEFQGYN
jgi:hypothetical protein